MYKALIIDDEKRAINILRILLEKHVPEIGTIEVAHGALNGLQAFETTKPDLVFLDVEMPLMSGFEVLSNIRESHPGANVIFTTAYDHYAIRAIRFSAIDYLLKPIDIDELRAAVQRFLSTISEPQNPSDLIDNLLSNLKSIHIQKPRLAVPTQGGAVFFDIDEIVRCESQDNYTTFHLKDGQRFVASRTLKEYDSLLAEYQFLRVHQSHLVNPAYVKEYTQKGMIEMTDDSRVPVSRRKHHWVQATLREMYS